MSISVKVKDWGNSVGVILPKKFVDENSIRSGEEILIEIHKKQNILKELFGSAHLKKPVKQIVKEAREELDSRWLV